MAIHYPFFHCDFNRAKNYEAEYPGVSKIFDYPMAFWFGVKRGWHDVEVLTHRVQRLLHRAEPYLPIMVIYNLPDRDIGQWSKGGAKTCEQYLEFIQNFANALEHHQPIIIFEPDGLPHSTLQSDTERKLRIQLMRDGLTILSEQTQALIYADIGHSNWLSASQAGDLLNQVTPAKGIRGFSVNVSNYRTTAESMRWGNEVLEHTDLGYYVVDTSRNGSGPYGNEWCNPPGRSLGCRPTTLTGDDRCDAFLWIKVPGESDGRCNGGPRAGKFWPEYAQELVQNTHWIR